MKNCKIIAVLLFQLCIGMHSYAGVFTITVADHIFTPANLTVAPGDTIIWKWQAGVHTTTSKTIPVGAISWNNAITATDTSFMYITSVTGIYSYECTVDSPTVMPGEFIVTNNPRKSNNPILTVYPNPAAENLHVTFNSKRLYTTNVPVSVIMIDINNITWINKVFKSLKETDIDLQDIPNGTYYFHAVQGNNTFDEQLVIAH